MPIKYVDSCYFYLANRKLSHITLNGNKNPQGETAKYLVIYLDRRLTWRSHIFAKGKQTELKLKKNVLLSVMKIGAINRK
jgi:hypothetical protein